jgi:hypothetical protein
MELLTRFGEATYYTFTNPQPSDVAIGVMKTVIGLVVLSVILYFVVEYMVKKSKRDPLPADPNLKDILTAQIQRIDKKAYDGQKSFYSDLINKLSENERFLANLCPLTATIGGYLGPLSEGVFHPSYYLRKALRAGIRSFVLPISVYYDDNKRPPNWPKARNPAIVCRDTAGKVISLNGLTVEAFCKSLMQFRAENPAQIEDPIFIYLDAVEGYIPDPVTQEKEYVEFTRQIARELAPLDSLRLTVIGPYGSAVGGRRQNDILVQVPLDDLRNKIIISTNFDITIGIKDAYESLRPRLYDYVNFYYQPMGAITETTGSALGAKAIHIEDVKGSKVNWTEIARTSWVMTTLDHVTTLPDTQLVDTVIKQGIQTVPIPFFFLENPELDKILAQWQGYSVRIKEPRARYTKPKPIVPARPSETLNARVDNTLQPGQLMVKS